MKTTTFLTSLLFGAALAQDAQAPLKDKAQAWFDKAKAYIPSAAPSIPNPIDAGASAVAADKVQKVNIRNYQRILAPKLDGEEEWLIYTTGGNKSCFGRCGKADLAWNESVPLLTALPQSAGSAKLQLGKIDCEKEGVLCAGWAVGCPGVYHFLVPAQQSGVEVKVPARYVDLNTTTVSVQDIVKLATNAPNSIIMSKPIYDGALHPIDGWMAKAGLQKPLGHVINFAGTTPSWIIMIGISFLSRQFMGRRAAGGRGIPEGGAAPGGAAGPNVRAPAAAAKPATPGSAGKGGKKRR